MLLNVNIVHVLLKKHVVSKRSHRVVVQCPSQDRAQKASRGSIPRVLGRDRDVVDD